jgi:DNA repair protein RadA/Sms
MDRVLGGGLVAGSAVLVGGDPGIGKSTLLLQVLEKIAARGSRVLYVTGEESARQIRLRGKRVGAVSSNLLVLVEIGLDNILRHIQEVRPAAVVVDSIQTVYSSVLSSRGERRPGREVGAANPAVEEDRHPLFLVGHVTKTASIAGPGSWSTWLTRSSTSRGFQLRLRVIRGIKNGSDRRTRSASSR